MVIHYASRTASCVKAGERRRHRLMRGGSDLAADRWHEDYRIAGTDDLDLHHLHRAMAWLGGELRSDQQDGATPFSPRCTKFAHRRDLFGQLDLVFMDTTSLYFEGLGGQLIGQHGYSKDHRPDLRQMILAVLIDGDGRPVCAEMWPGNTADVTSLVPVIDRLRQRFAIGRVCIVADRGMISAETITTLEARDLLYILGVRERTDKLVREGRAQRCGAVRAAGDREAAETPSTVPRRSHWAVRATSSASTIRRRRRRMLPSVPPFWPHWNAGCVATTRRWSATPAIAASSRPSAKTTSPLIASRPRRTPALMMCSCCAPTPISARWLPCCATSSSGPSSRPSAPPSTCSPRVRSSTSLTRPSAATCSAASSLSYSRPNWTPASQPSATVPVPLLAHSVGDASSLVYYPGVALHFSSDQPMRTLTLRQQTFMAELLAKVMALFA
jgi:hypothetical protein